jgi:hypothetical protein
MLKEGKNVTTENFCPCNLQFSFPRYSVLSKEFKVPTLQSIFPLSSTITIIAIITKSTTININFHQDNHQCQSYSSQILLTSIAFVATEVVKLMFLVNLSLSCTRRQGARRKTKD